MSYSEVEKKPLDPKRRRKRYRRYSIALALFVVVWLSTSWIVATKLTQRRYPIFDEPAPVVVWAQFDSLRLSTTDGESLGAWFHQGRTNAPAVLFLHGNGGSRKDGIKRAELLVKEGCSVLLISLRAHGDSTGEYNDIGYSAQHDVRAAVGYLEDHCPGRPIVILGTSLGAAAAVFAADDLGQRVSGYILESPYRDLKTAVWNRIELALPPILATIVYRGLLTVSPLVIPHLDQIAPVDVIDQIPKDIPILIMAGAADRMARPEEAEALWCKVRQQARLYLFERTDHLRMFDTDPARYRAAVLELLDAASRHRKP